jgi:DNA-binding transcriptional ArsR family regulator
MANPYGDVELDARGMRALAHPVRLALLTRLQQDGPSTATRLATVVGASPSVTSWHLRHLAEHGLVRDATEAETQRQHGRERWWAAVSRGFRFAGGPDGGRDAGMDAGTDGGTDDAWQAATALTRVIEAVEGDLVQTWREEAEPRLEARWRRLSGRASTRILATADELAALDAAWEELLAPYVLRKDAPAAELPAGARGVRILRYTMPEAQP